MSRLSTVCVDFAARGVTTPRGKPFTARNLARTLALKRYGGYVVHHGEVVGRIPGEPVFDASTYDAVQALLTSRRRGRRPTDRSS